MTATQTPIEPTQALEARFQAAIAAAFPELDKAAAALITTSRQPELGDFQSNAAMPLAKRLKLKPREVAEKIIEHLDVSGIAEPIGPDSIAGPGFINIRLSTAALTEALAALDGPDLGLPAPAEPMTVVVDVCGVNLAKQMHVGHLRSTVIGDAMARLFERLGHTVIRQSHVGDWGLPIAMVVERLIVLEAAGSIELDTISLDALNAIYKAAQAECRPERKALEIIKKTGGHPKAEAELELRIEHAEAALERAKQRLVLLQGGDDQSVAVWRRIYDITMAACLANCARLFANVTDENSAGESTYRDELGPLVEDLVARGLAEESDGALVVRVPGHKEPCIVRKRDGGFLYATTDLAAIRRRVQKLKGDRVIYCVDARQSLHFKLVFAAARLAGYDIHDGRTASLEHAAFGMVLGEDNRPFKTRSGETAKLTDLLDEAVQRASATVAEKNPDLSAAERATISEAVAMAAIKYTDLSNERIKDYVFSFDRMLAFEGDTGPYLLNAVVRVRSIFRKAAEEGIDTANIASADLILAEPDERTLALTLLRYPRAVRQAADTIEPSRLCAFVYELARAYSGFYERCPVLQAKDERVRASRLRLCDLTARVLEDGLHTLGLPTLERM